MGLELRAFERRDSAAVAALLGELGYPTSPGALARRFAHLLAHPDCRAVVAINDREVVGFVGLFHHLRYEQDSGLVEIAALVTGAAHRGRGVGRALVREAERWAQEVRASGIYLTTAIRAEREDAHAFYRALGYEVISLKFYKAL